jgi:hypothetical protein
MKAVIQPPSPQSADIITLLKGFFIGPIINCLLDLWKLRSGIVPRDSKVYPEVNEVNFRIDTENCLLKQFTDRQ